MSLHVSANGRYVIKVLIVTPRSLLNDAFGQDATSLVSGLTRISGLEEAPAIESALNRMWGFPFERTDSKRCLLISINS